MSRLEDKEHTEYITERYRDKIAELEADNEKLGIELGLLQVKCNMVREYDAKTKKYGPMEKTIFQKCKELEAKVATIMEAERKEQARLINERDTLKAEVATAHKVFGTESDKLGEIVTKLKAEVTAWKDIAEGGHSIHISDQKAIVHARKEITKLKSHLEQKTALVEELKKENEKECDELVKDVEKALTQKKELQSQVDQLKEELTGLRGRYKTLWSTCKEALETVKK